MRDQSQPPDTGPPRSKVDAPESNWSISQSRYQPDATSESLHFRLWRQVASRRPLLPSIGKALSPGARHRLRAMVAEGSATP